MMTERVLLADLLVDKPLLADWFGATSAKGKISACIPAGAKRSHPAIHDVLLHKQQHKSENMFGRLKEWRRVVCAMSAVRTPYSLASVVPLRVFLGSE